MNRMFRIDTDLVITPNQTIVVEPGTQFLFGPNVGITIQERGKFILNGSEGAPISMSSTGVGAWRGVTVKPGTSSSVPIGILFRWKYNGPPCDTERPFHRSMA